MGEIVSVTFNIGDDTLQIVGEQLLIWKGVPDHKPDFEFEMEDIRRLISAAGFLRKL